MLHGEGRRLTSVISLFSPSFPKPVDFTGEPRLCRLRLTGVDIAIPRKVLEARSELPEYQVVISPPGFAEGQRIINSYRKEHQSYPPGFAEGWRHPARDQESSEPARIPGGVFGCLPVAK